MASTSDRTREILRKVRQIEIRTRRFVDDTLAGAWHSAFKGTGIDFSEVREYLPGDDVRAIDWNVTARMNRPFVKLYEEERELTIMLLIDHSASADFTSTGVAKRELAAEIAASLAFSATRNQDKVGLLLFTDRVELFIRPRKGRQHILRVIREVLFHQPRGRGTDLAGALRTLNRLLHRRAVCFLLSDFLTADAPAADTPVAQPATPRATTPATATDRMLRLTARRHDLVCLELADPREWELPDVGLIALEDAENGELVEVDTANPRLRALYAATNANRRAALRHNLRRAGIDHLAVTTDQPYLQTLRRFFAARKARR
jgi:uncharacterized protein (DUF58 family)